MRVRGGEPKAVVDDPAATWACGPAVSSVRLAGCEPTSRPDTHRWPRATTTDERWWPLRIRELELYAEQCGDEALARQVEIGKTRYRCCWNDNDGPHHPLCPVGRNEAA